MPRVVLLLTILCFTVLALGNNFRKALFTSSRRLSSSGLNIGTAKSYLTISRGNQASLYSLTHVFILRLMCL